MRTRLSLTLVLALAAAPLAAKEIAGAAYVEPTDAYGHGALKGGEYAGLEITYDDGTTNEIRFTGAVYEDTAPRLVDLDGDGGPEVIAVMSGFDVGAMVQVVDFDGEWARPVGNSPAIGQRHRWLAVAGVADFNGDGRWEVAYVDRPHLARTLRLLTVEMGAEGVRFTPLAQAEGLSNHLIGNAAIEGGVHDCPGAAPVVLSANADWTRVMETRWSGSGLTSRAVADYTGPESFAPYLSCD